jgi:hypothetical protein
MSASPEPTCQAIFSLTFLLVTYYNYKKPGYFSCNCPKPRHADLKKIKKDKDKRALKLEKDHA